MGTSTRVIVAAAAVGSCAAAILRMWACAPDGQARSSERPPASVAKTAPAARASSFVTVTGENAERIAQDIAARAEKSWISQGLNPREAGLARHDVEIVVGAALSKRYAPYARLMAERGATLGATAGPYAAQQWKYSEYEAVAEELRQKPVEEQVAYLWEHPEARNVGIAKVDDGVALFGLKDEYGTEWAGGAFGHYSFFLAPGFKIGDMARAYADGSVDSAWVQLPVVLSSGDHSVLRWNFGYVKRLDAWFPVIHSVPAGPRRVVPMW